MRILGSLPNHIWVQRPNFRGPSDIKLGRSSYSAEACEYSDGTYHCYVSLLLSLLCLLLGLLCPLLGHLCLLPGLLCLLLGLEKLLGHLCLLLGLEKLYLL